MNEFVSVIVPTYQRFNLFLRAIESLTSQDYGKNNFEVIAIHDGVDCDYDKVQISKSVRTLQFFKFFKVPHCGVGQIRNLGIQISRGSLVLMLDDDCEADSHWISSLVLCMENNKSAVGAGGTVLSCTPETFVQHYIAFKNLLRRPVRDVNNQIVTLVTANACFRKEILESVGGFRKEFIYAGGEDVDLSFRCRTLGELVYCENAIVYHHHRSTLKSLIHQHILYGRGTYLACALNKVDFRLLKFYKPTLLNFFRYLGFITKRTFTVSLPEFKQKRLNIFLYIPYAVLDAVRKFSFLVGATLEYYKM